MFFLLKCVLCQNIEFMKYLVFLILVIFTLSCSKDKTDLPLPPSGYWNMTMIKVAYALGMIDEIKMEFPVPEDLIEYKDVVYTTEDSVDLKLDIYHLKNLKEKRPLLLFIHGGGYTKGNKRDYLVYTCAFAQKGYVTASLQYKFVNDVKFPAQLYELKEAVKWLKQNADSFNIDTSKIALIGGSAGAHLALMGAYTADVKEFNEDSTVSYRVQAVVDLYGPVDLTTKYAREHPTIENMFGKTYREDPEIYFKSSPLMYVSKDDPPTLIFQGTIDNLVPVSQSDTLAARLKRTGVPVEYHRLKGWPHAMDVEVEVNKYCQFYMNRFFEKYVPINE